MTIGRTKKKQRVDLDGTIYYALNLEDLSAMITTKDTHPLGCNLPNIVRHGIASLVVSTSVTDYPVGHLESSPDINIPLLFSLKYYPMIHTFFQVLPYLQTTHSHTSWTPQPSNKPSEAD
jgi:hypothetical protein